MSNTDILQQSQQHINSSIHLNQSNSSKELQFQTQIQEILVECDQKISKNYLNHCSISPNDKRKSKIQAMHCYIKDQLECSNQLINQENSETNQTFEDTECMENDQYMENHKQSSKLDDSQGKDFRKQHSKSLVVQFPPSQLTVNNIMQQIENLSYTSKKINEEFQELNKDFLNNKQKQNYINEEVFNRNYNQHQIIQNKLQKLKQEQDQHEMSNVSIFTASKASQDIIKGKYTPIQQRTLQIQKQKQQKQKELLIQQQKEKENKELEQCTFKPNLHKKKNQKRTNEEFLIDQNEWMKNSKNKILGQKLLLEVKKTNQHTFKPSINCEKNKDQALDQPLINCEKNKDQSVNFGERLFSQSIVYDEKRKKLQNIQKYSFQPYISPKSLELASLRNQRDRIVSVDLTQLHFQ